MQNFNESTYYKIQYIKCSRKNGSIHYAIKRKQSVRSEFIVKHLNEVNIRQILKCQIKCLGKSLFAI